MRRIAAATTLLAVVHPMLASCPGLLRLSRLPVTAPPPLGSRPTYVGARVEATRGRFRLE
jgi:hypothetical protein